MTPEEAIAKLKTLPEDRQRAVLAKLSPEERKGIMTQLSGPASNTPTDAAGRTPTGEAPPGDTRNSFQRFADNLSTPDPRREAWQTPTERNAGGFGTSLAASVLQPIAHPVNTAKSLMRSIAAGRGDPTATAGELLRPMIEKGIGDYQKHGGLYASSNVLGSLTGGAAAGELGGAALRTVVPKVGGALSDIRSAAIGDPDVAALKGLHVQSNSPRTLGTLRAVGGSRPFLQGAQSLEDLQTRIPAAKSEIWGPYQQTVDALSDKAVNGPDGPTTVGKLESERGQLSALNRQLKSRTPNPEALQLAQQKGLNQAQLLARERSVQNSLDPVLRDAGIQPKAIRQAFGQVSQVGERVSGKATLAEPTERYGFSKAADLSLTKPLENVATIGSGLRDIAAGRYWSAKPTDVSIREAFRTGSPKPDFGQFNPTPGPPPLQLPSSTIGNAEFTDYPEALKGQGIEASQRKIADPEYLRPNTSAIPLNAPPKPVKPFDTDLYLQHLRGMQ